jgi:hypothetical protein
MEGGVEIIELNRMASNLLVFRPNAALMVLPCTGSLNHVTMCHVIHTTITKVGNSSLSFSTPMHTITINFLSLLSRFKISQSFIRLLEASCHSLTTSIPPKNRNILSIQLCFANPLAPVNILKRLKLKTLILV